MSGDVFAAITALGTVITAGAVVVGVAQLRLAQREAERLGRNEQTSFEDDLSREYRALVGELPAEAFFTDGSLEDLAGYRRSFYRYFDLSNEQLFYGKRVSHETHEQWSDGIAANLRLPVFQAAWLDLLPHLDDATFEDLRELRKRYEIPGPVIGDPVDQG